MKILLFQDRAGHCRSFAAMDFCGHGSIPALVMSIRVGDSGLIEGNPIVWVRPKEKVRVHPEREGEIFHNEIEVGGIEFDLYVRGDPGTKGCLLFFTNGKPDAVFHPATYEES